MELTTLLYAPHAGWSAPFPPLDSEQTLVLVFGAAGYADQPAPLHQLAAAYPRSVLLGCSTAGEILDGRLYDDSLVVAVVRFTRTRLQRASAPVQSAIDSYAAGSAIARDLAGVDLRAVLVTSDGHNVNGSDLVRGLNAGLPDTVVVTGGLAGDGPRFQRTWLLSGGVPRAGFVAAVGLYGDAVRVAHGSKGGWDIFGPERRVTRSEGNVLYELDGRPALDLYKRYLGERAMELPASALLFPLSLRTTPTDPHPVVRTILAVDEQRNALVFAGDIPNGALAQLMRANFDRLIEGASDAAGHLGLRGISSGPLLCIAVSCVGRRLVLGERAEEELEATIDMLPVGARQVGFYSYGELSPLVSGRCELHNQTMTLTAIQEA